ncbi:serine/threonine-protein kinase [Gordonia paraffinivorans]|uniref:serine/threonine-protein kinase n=1 Tax=Gordonia paraffinivorans TaxID=175628 RepID=UPI0024926C3D|nr:serine/threonine-protein kinase [Gordonia paraffinivorans]
MQYIEGTDAAELLRTAPAPLPADQAVDIIAQAGAGLDHAHAFGMLHRDVKPANILVAENIGPRGRPRVLVADFGVARLLDDSAGLTETGMVVGTLAYAAPEMFAAAELTPAVDIYALGCVLYELLTGEQVFTGRDALALINAHGTTPPPRVTALRPDLPPAIDDVVFRALAKDPAQRFTSCADLADAALAALSDAAGPRSSPTTGTRREHRQWTSASTRPLRPPTTAPRRRHSSPTPGHALPCRPQPTRARRKRFSPKPGTGLPRRPRTARPGHNPCLRPSPTGSTRTPRRRRLRIPPCTTSRPRTQRHPRTPGLPARNHRAAETRCRTFSRAARCCSSSRSSRSARCT